MSQLKVFRKCWWLAVVLCLSTMIPLTAWSVPPAGVDHDPQKAEGDDRNSDPSKPEVGNGILYYPRIHSDTRDQGRWRIFIESFYQDPPSTIIVYIYNDSPQVKWETEVDLLVEIGWFDYAVNYMRESHRIVKDIPILPGMNKVPVQVHNDKGQVVRARLLAVRSDQPIEPFSATE